MTLGRPFSSPLQLFSIFPASVIIHSLVLELFEVAPRAAFVSSSLLIGRAINPKIHFFLIVVRLTVRRSVPDDAGHHHVYVIPSAVDYQDAVLYKSAAVPRVRRAPAHPVRRASTDLQRAAAVSVDVDCFLLLNFHPEIIFRKITSNKKFMKTKKNSKNFLIKNIFL